MNVQAKFRLIICGLIWLGLCSLQTDLKAPDRSNREAVSVITRFEVRAGYQEQFKQALKNYVAASLVNQRNIMAEGYTEQGQPLVFWIIERWSSKRDFERSSQSASFKTIAALGKRALSTTAQSIWLRDLEPVAQKQWRASANSSDKPLTIMLFVDAKPGTAHRFMKVYHEAMPKFRSEPGVINYQLSQFVDDSTRFVTYERFRSEEAFQYHLNFPPIQPVLDYLNTSIKKQPFQTGLHRLIAFTSATHQ